MYKNREEAGQKLAEKLMDYKNRKDAIILSLPRGGVVVGAEISKILNVPMDIVVPRKIGASGNPEYAIGALTEYGEAIFNERERQMIDEEWLKKEIEKERKEASRRLSVFRGKKPLPDILDKIVIIVDDGIATGLTMRAAVASIKAKKPKQIIVAAPASAKDSFDEIKKEVDDIISLEIPEFFGAVGNFYEDFPQVEDEEVIRLLKF